MKFHARFIREFGVDIEAESSEIAQKLAHQVTTQFPDATCKVLSITVEGYVERPCVGCQEDGPVKPRPSAPPHGSPLGGGSPGTPTATVPVLVDQVAASAA